jgi:hypothetical protein
MVTWTRNSNDVFALCVLFGILLVELIRKLCNHFGMTEMLEPKLRAMLTCARWRSKLTSPPLHASFVNRTHTHTHSHSKKGSLSTTALSIRIPQVVIHKPTHEQTPLLTKHANFNPKSPKPLRHNTIDNNKSSSASTKLDLTSANTYDLYKVVITLCMIIDHYGLFMPTVPYTQRSWMRVYGRVAAPSFFFLCGYSSKRFRMRTWVAALFLYVFTVVVPIDIVH